MEIADMENQCNGDYHEILPGRYVMKDVTSLLCHNRLTGQYHHSNHHVSNMDCFWLCFTRSWVHPHKPFINQ